MQRLRAGLCCLTGLSGSLSSVIRAAKIFLGDVSRSSQMHGKYTGTDRGGSMKNLSMETKTLILLIEKGLEEKKLPPKDPISQRCQSEILKSLLMFERK